MSFEQQQADKFDAVQQALDNSTHADEFMRELFRLGYVVIKL